MDKKCTDCKIYDMPGATLHIPCDVHMTIKINQLLDRTV